MEGLDTVLWQVLPVVISIAAPVLLILAGWVAKKIGAKLDVSTQETVNNLVTNLTAQGVAYAEQIAKKRAKENEVINGQSKLYIATEFVIEQLNKHNVPDVAAAEIQKRIEAVLGMDTMNSNEAMNILGPRLNGLDEDEDDFHLGD